MKRSATMLRAASTEFVVGHAGVTPVRRHDNPKTIKTAPFGTTIIIGHAPLEHATWIAAAAAMRLLRKISGIARTGTTITTSPALTVL